MYVATPPECASALHVLKGDEQFCSFSVLGGHSLLTDDHQELVKSIPPAAQPVEVEAATVFVHVHAADDRVVIRVDLDDATDCSRRILDQLVLDGVQHSLADGAVGPAAVTVLDFTHDFFVGRVMVEVVGRNPRVSDLELASRVAQREVTRTRRLVAECIALLVDALPPRVVVVDLNIVYIGEAIDDRLPLNQTCALDEVGDDLVSHLVVLELPEQCLVVLDVGADCCVIERLENGEHDAQFAEQIGVLMSHEGLLNATYCLLLSPRAYCLSLTCEVKTRLFGKLLPNLKCA